MALNIKNQMVEALASELAEKAGVSKTAIIRQALIAHRDRLQLQALDPKHNQERWHAFLEREIWPELAAQRPITKDEIENILGYGEGGV